MENNKEKFLDKKIHKKNKFIKDLNKRLSKCDGKVIFNKKNHAELAMKKMNDHHLKKGNPIFTTLNVYKCVRCGNFHIGRIKGSFNWNLLGVLK